jgi:hypothetical protein
MPRTCVQLSTDGEQERFADALLQDLAADLDDAGVLAWLLEQGEFATAEEVIDASAAADGDPEAVRDARDRLRRREEESQAQLRADVGRLLDSAEAAGVPAPDVAHLLADADDLRLTGLLDRLARQRKELNAAIEVAKDDARSRMARRKHKAGVPKPLLTAWHQRVDRGQLVAAERLLAIGESETSVPPDAVQWLRGWDPTIDTSVVLQQITRSTYRGSWNPGPDGQSMLEAYLRLRASRTEHAAADFSAAFVEFLGGTSARQPIAWPGGYSFRFDLSPVTSALPLAWLSDIKVVLHLPGELLAASVSAEERLIVVDCGAGTEHPVGRSNSAVLAPGDLIRLSTVSQHRSLHLLRLLGRSWTSRALGVGNSGALETLLAVPEPAAWGRLSWLLDVLGLGGTELVREMTEQVGFHPKGLHLLLESLLRMTGSRSRDARRQRWMKADMASQLGQAVLPSRVPGPAGRVVFLALLAADGFDTPLEVSDLALSIALEGGDASERVLEQGLLAVAHHPLVESGVEPAPGIRLRHCAVLRRMRQEAPRMLLEALAELDTTSGAESAWNAHRWALLPGGIGDRTLESALQCRAQAIASAEPAPVTHDVIRTIEELVTDCRSAFPTVHLDHDMPASASAAFPRDALRTIVAEVLQNAVDELEAGQRDRIQINVQIDAFDVSVDIIDDGNGVDLPNPHGAVFRPGRSTRGAARGHGLFDAKRLADSLGAQLVLVAPASGGSLRGAHFNLALPREPEPQK